METPDLKEVPKIHDSSLRDVPARLRELADAIERGQYEGMCTCAVVLAYGYERRIAVFGYGDRSEHDTIGLTLLAGANVCAGNLG